MVNYGILRRVYASHRHAGWIFYRSIQETEAKHHHDPVAGRFQTGGEKKAALGEPWGDLYLEPETTT